jgi:dTDP-3-amino-2,3,6-trideoxy-4-keto-D-glucose/dTDP-3-amino-3,4,6-trideoxy-alpha-D-glucose/dTDP-2,6-dideoxy-D-kanosamine transaminase
VRPIAFWDYRAEFEEERADIAAAVEAVFRSGRLILGEQLARFELQFSASCGLRFGVGVNSGTDALFLGLKALDIGHGDEVITVANTAVPTVAAIRATGASVRFVDIDPNTYLMDVDRLAEAVSLRTRCILPVHLYGQCVRMESVRSVAERYGARIVEDCAQSQGAERNHVKAGAMSDVSAFSFYPTKILGAYGDAGMICTDDPSLAVRLKRLRMYGMDTARQYSDSFELFSSYYSEEEGFNSRLDEVQAAILLSKLPRVEMYLEKRRAIARRYDELLADTDIVLPKVDEGNTHAYYLYVCRHPARDAIVAGLSARGISLKVDYPWPIHLMRGYASLNYKAGDLPRTEDAAREIFSLPIYPTFPADDQAQVCEVLHEVLATLPASPRA